MPFIRRFTISAAAMAFAAASHAVPSELESEVAWLTNLERAEAGLSPLKHVNLLNDSASGHSEAMRDGDFFAHCDLLTGKSPFVRMADVGYQFYTAAENIAAGQADAADVVSTWMNSAGHRANILGSNYREIGVGHAYDPNDNPGIARDSNGDCVADGSTTFPLRRYWTQNFGARSGVYPAIIDFEAPVVDACVVQVFSHGDGWANDYRVRQQGQPWSAWQPFSPWTDLAVTGSNGEQISVDLELRRGSSVKRATDSTRLGVSCAGSSATDMVHSSGFE